MNTSRRRVATCECADCHCIVPKTEAVAVEEEKKSGRVGWGFSLSSKTDGTGGRRSVSSGRNLYSTKTVWYCNECYEIRRTGSNAAAATLVALVIGVGLAVHGSKIGWGALLLDILTGTVATFFTVLLAVVVWVSYALWRAHFRLVDQRDEDSGHYDD